MEFVPAPDVIQAELRFLNQGQRCENVLYFQGSAGVNPSLADNLGEALANWWEANFAPTTSNQMSLTEVYMTDLTSNDSFTVSYTAGLPIVGESAIEPLPNNCAHCVSFRTAGRGRSARGRNYVMGMTENDCAGSIISTSVVNAHVTAYSFLPGAGGFVPGLQWVIVSRFLNKAPRTTALVRPVTSVLSVDNVIDSQRRRLPGRGT